MNIDIKTVLDTPNDKQSHFHLLWVKRERITDTRKGGKSAREMKDRDFLLEISKWKVDIWESVLERISEIGIFECLINTRSSLIINKSLDRIPPSTLTLRYYYPSLRSTNTVSLWLRTNWKWWWQQQHSTRNDVKVPLSANVVQAKSSHLSAR